MKKFVRKFYLYLMSWPMDRQNKFFEIVLSIIPIWLLKLIPCSYSIYLRCYTPQKGDIVLDCGSQSHHGNCSILFSRLVGKNGKVIALEPCKDSVDIMDSRIKRLKRDNITIFNKGIWSNIGKFYLETTSNSLMCRTINGEEYAQMENKEAFSEVDCVTIDDLVSQMNLRQLNMIKMDLEGAEIEALEGAVNTMKNFSPCFVVASYHERDNEKTCHKVEVLLNNNGYSSYTFFPPHLTTCGRKVDPVCKMVELKDGLG